MDTGGYNPIVETIKFIDIHISAHTSYYSKGNVRKPAGPAVMTRSFIKEKNNKHMNKIVNYCILDHYRG